MADAQETSPTAIDSESCNVEGRSMAHKFVWLWEGPTMSDKVRCSTCGVVRTNNRDGMGAVGVAP